MLLFEGELFADYHQLYLRDEGADALPDDYSDDSMAARMSIGSTAAIIFTPRNMDTPLRVEWLDAAPEDIPPDFDHAVEGSFESMSGRLVVADLTDYEAEAQRIAVPPGLLGIRVLFYGLSTISENGLDGEDRCVVQLWSAVARIPTRVLKDFG